MRADYWDVEESQVIEKTGHGFAHWTPILDAFEGKPGDMVSLLVAEHGVPRYWARTLVTRHQKGAR